jgi:hypothetical protein
MRSGVRNSKAEKNRSVAVMVMGVSVVAQGTLSIGPSPHGRRQTFP